MLAIETKKLTKTYHSKEVLHAIDLNIESGKIVGFLGPNGAGKSTTIRILMGLIHATSGSAEILGRPIKTMSHELRERIGYLPGEVNLYKNLSGKGTIRFVARARGRQCEAYATELAKRLDLDLNIKVGKHSSGMKQKLGLILALMHEPDLLILDEPTSALDPLVKKTVFDLLHEFCQGERTVLFSSHSLNEVDELCDEVVILRAGSIVEHQAIDRLKEKAVRRIRLEFTQMKSTPQHSCFHLKNKKNREVAGSWTGSTVELLKFIESANPDNFVVEPPDLEDLFLAYYSGDKGSISTEPSAEFSTPEESTND